MRLVGGRGLPWILGLALVALNLILANLLAARYPARLDWTPSRAYSLSPRAAQIIDRLDRPVRVTLFMVPPEPGEESLYHETRELLRRLADRSPLIGVEAVDVDADPTRTELLARRYSIDAGDLRQGVVVFASDGRSRYVAAAEMAEFELLAGRRRMISFRGEEALLRALLQVAWGVSRTVCFSTDHEEADPRSTAGTGVSAIVEEVRREGYRVRLVGGAEILAGLEGCDLLVMNGPRRALAPGEASALEERLRRGGRLLLLLGPALDRRATALHPLGLEALLARWGVKLLDRIVVDPLAVPGEPPFLTWATREGYNADHPLGRTLAGKLTVWPLARGLEAVTGARGGLEVSWLVRSGAEGWAESDLASLRGDRPLVRDASTDTPGPVPVALAVRWRQMRLVVLGTERGMMNARIAAAVGRDHNRDLFLATVGWLVEAGRPPLVIGPRRPEHVQLALEGRQLGQIFLVSVVALPLGSFLVGIAVWWRRRR